MLQPHVVEVILVLVISTEQGGAATRTQTQVRMQTQCRYWALVSAARSDRPGNYFLFFRQIIPPYTMMCLAARVHLRHNSRSLAKHQQ
jgi:hypothetical protein